MIEQNGDEKIVPFSFMNENIDREQVSCWLTYTNEETHKIISRKYWIDLLCIMVHIEGVGPRYCPSIEDKIMKIPR